MTFINAQFNGEIPQPHALNAEDEAVLRDIREKAEEAAQEFENAKLQSAANTLISISRVGNQYLNEKEPWNLIKTNREKAATILYVSAQIVKAAAVISLPFIPNSAEALWKELNLSGSVKACSWQDCLKPLEAGHQIAKSKPLFQKIVADEKDLNERLEKVRAKNAS